MWTPEPLDGHEKTYKRGTNVEHKWGRLDSNQRPIDYESIALTN